MDREKLQAEIDALPWYHEFDFGNGLRAVSKAEDVAGHRQVWAFIDRQLDAIDFRGKTVLDIGCWDGYWSFAAEKRGAAAVLASDDFSQNWSSSRNVYLAKRLLGSNVEINPSLSIYRLAELGRQFDVIMCLGVFYHLVDPFYAFAQIRHCCHPGTIAVFEGNVTYGLPDSAVLWKAEVGWSRFTPTVGALAEMLSAAYLRPVEQVLLSPRAGDDGSPPAPAASLPPHGRVGWQWRLRMTTAAVSGSRPAIKAAADVLFPPPPPPPLPAPPSPLKVDSRIFVRCEPLDGVNPLHYYFPPFGLHAYDPRFRSEGIDSEGTTRKIA